MSGIWISHVLWIVLAGLLSVWCDSTHLGGPSRTSHLCSLGKHTTLPCSCWPWLWAGLKKTKPQLFKTVESQNPFLFVFQPLLILPSLEKASAGATVTSKSYWLYVQHATHSDSSQDKQTTPTACNQAAIAISGIKSMFSIWLLKFFQDSLNLKDENSNYHQETS